jgi:hypothetical protein
MGDKSGRNKLKGPSTELRTGPGGPTMRELRELKKGRARDRTTDRAHNKLAQPQSRWQRFVRYVWDKNRGRG